MAQNEAKPKVGNCRYLAASRGIRLVFSKIANNRFHFSSPEVSTVYAAKLREVPQLTSCLGGSTLLPRFGRNRLIPIEGRYLNKAAVCSDDGLRNRCGSLRNNMNAAIILVSPISISPISCTKGMRITRLISIDDSA